MLHIMQKYTLKKFLALAKIILVKDFEEILNYYLFHYENVCLDLPIHI